MDVAFLGGKQSRLKVTDDFPGFGKMPNFIEEVVERHGLRAVLDIGGGAKPMLPPDLVNRRSLDYTVLDISQRELDKAEGSHKRICVDVAAPESIFFSKVGHIKIDLAFSHMVFEHLQDPIQAHRNVYSILRPGGLAVHLYPSPNNLPLTMNRLAPPWLTDKLVEIAQPERDFRGRQGKFPVYYKLCGFPSTHLRRTFETLGYEVIEHAGYVGHSYYDRIPALRNIEKAMRAPLARARIPLISNVMLVLRKK